MTYVLSEEACALATNKMYTGSGILGTVTAAIELEIAAGRLQVVPQQVAPVMADAELIKVTFVKPQDEGTVAPPSTGRVQSRDF